MNDSFKSFMDDKKNNMDKFLVEAEKMKIKLKDMEKKVYEFLNENNNFGYEIDTLMLTEYLIRQILSITSYEKARKENEFTFEKMINCKNNENMGKSIDGIINKKIIKNCPEQINELKEMCKRANNYDGNLMSSEEKTFLNLLVSKIEALEKEIEEEEKEAKKKI